MYRQYVQSGIAPGANTVTTSAIAANTIQPWQLSSSLLNPTVNSFTGDGTTTSFTLSLPPASANTVVVTVNGITQSPVTNYSTNNTSLVFTSAPSNASVIRAVQQAMIGTSIVPIDGSVTNSKLGSNLTLSGNTSFSGAISGTSVTLSSTLGVTGVTTLTAQPILSSLTASSAVATDASKGLVSVTNTGSGNNVLAASPTLTGTVAAASLSLSSLTSGRVTYAGASGLLTDSAGLTYDGTNLNLTSAAGAVRYTATGATAMALYADNTAGYIGTENNFPLVFQTNNAGRMWLNATGLGIGTSSPTAKLDISVASAAVDGTKGVRLANPAGTTVLFECGVSSDSFVGTTSASDFNIRTNNTERVKFPFNGGVQAVTSISVGNATPSASGAGITFPATQSASSDANTLDDYEEGTWTPTDNSGAGLTFTINSSQYTKIGRAVTVNFEIVWPSTADGSNVSVSLPFNSGAANRAGMSAFSNVAGEVNIYTPGGANFNLYNDTGTQITNATMSTKYLIVSLTYFV